MDIDLWLHLTFIGLGVIILATVIECITHLLRGKLGLDKEYYLVIQETDENKEKVFKTNEVKIDIKTNVIEFKDFKTKKIVRIKEGYTYKEVSKKEWLSIDI